jgi:hypothetical protein
MFILATTRVSVLAILVSVPFQMAGTVALPNGDVPQSENSTPRHGQVRSSGLEMLTDTEGIDFDPYLLTALLSVRQNWYAVIPPSVESGQQWKNKYAGMEISEMRRMRLLEDENARLKKIVAQQALDIDALKVVRFLSASWREESVSR